MRGAAEVAETPGSVQAIHVNNLIHIEVLIQFRVAFGCLVLNWTVEIAYGCDVVV